MYKKVKKLLYFVTREKDRKLCGLNTLKILRDSKSIVNIDILQTVWVASLLSGTTYCVGRDVKHRGADKNTWYMGGI